MSKVFVSDNKAIVSLIGLRWVKRIDVRYHSDEEPRKYKIEVAYKGQETEIDYDKDIAARDAMFDKLIAAITPAP